MIAPPVDERKIMHRQQPHAAEAVKWLDVPGLIGAAAIARRLNQRPRKTLGFETPADRLQAVLH
jgi:hypothetical protein